MKYTIEIRETLSRFIEVDATSPENALNKVEQMYDDEEIVLDADDYQGTEFINQE